MSSLERNKEDFTCPICMYIMIQPVTMPCKHSLCMMCYKQCVEKANLACPICRLRISVWARKSAKTNTLIDRVMWETIQRRFPIEVRNHIDGKDDSTDDNWDSPSAIENRLRKFKELSEPGEIRQEYEAALAKLEKQREEEAKREEEASAALIRALQEKDEEELEKLAKEREEYDRLGRQAAEQIFQETCAVHSGRKLRDGERSNKDSKKRCESASMKLENFYSSYRKHSNSAPPYSELATTLFDNKRKSNTVQASKVDYSPYPYRCISPSEKQKVTPNLSPKEELYETIALSHCLQEHSYTTASAEKIDLTLQDEGIDWTSVLREDVQQYIKVEPPDIEDPLGTISSTSNGNCSFQPICSSLRTPPKKLPSGELVDPVLIRSIPRSLTFGFSERKALSPSASSCSSEIFPDQDIEFRNENSELNGNANCQRGMPSYFGHLVTGESEDEVVEKMKLTRKIVYGTSKHKKHGPVSSICPPLPCPKERSSHTSSETKSVTDDNAHVESSLRWSTRIDENANYNSDTPKICDKDESDVSDYFVSGDSRLLIPLESEVETSFSNSKSAESEKTMKKLLPQKLERQKENAQRLIKKKTPQKMARPKVSKSVDKSSCSTIRDWCLKNKRKSEPSIDPHDFANVLSNKKLTTEEADHLYALELQKLFSKQDTYNIKVDRFQGSSNEYSFRKKRRLN